MNRVARLFAMVTGLVLMLNNTSSGGIGASCSDPGCNSTVSDANENTAGGTSALINVDETGTGGFSNTAFGSRALGGATTGDHNTATGVDALVATTTGSFNTGTGVSALETNTEGTKNTAVGVSALSQSTGNKNIAIGFQAGTNLTTGHNNIYVGNRGDVVEYQTIRIGTAQTRTFIAGITPAIVGNAVTVQIDTATGQLGIPASSSRYKQDIAPMGTRSEKVLELRPVTFAYRDDAKAMTHYGLIAEEVAGVLPELVTRTAAGDVQTVKYQELIPMLLNELQRQREDLKRQQQELAELRALVAGQLAGQRTIAAGALVTQSETDEAVR